MCIRFDGQLRARARSITLTPNGCHGGSQSEHCCCYTKLSSNKITTILWQINNFTKIVTKIYFIVLALQSVPCTIRCGNSYLCGYIYFQAWPQDGTGRTENNIVLFANMSGLPTAIWVFSWSAQISSLIWQFLPMPSLSIYFQGTSIDLWLRQ